MVRRRVRLTIGIGVCLAVLASACSSGGGEGAGEDDDTDVLGIQVERDGTGSATVEPTLEPPSPSPDVTVPTPGEGPAGDGDAAASDDDASTVGDDGATVGRDEPDDDEADDGDAGSDPAPPARTSRPAPPPSPAPSPAPSPTPAPQALGSREGHSYVTWFRDEEPDGQGGSRYVWSEVSAAPVVTRDGSEPLRVSLVDLTGDPDRSAPRRAQCPAWIEVDGDRAVRAVGSLTVEVVVDGSTVSSGTRELDVTVQPGERRDLVAIGDVRVAVPDVAEVTCRVTFSEGASD